MNRLRHLVRGELVATDEPGLPSVDPTTEAVLCEQPIGQPATVDAAVNAARDAFDHGPWPRWPAAERARCLLTLAEHLQEHAEALARIETSDNGMPIRFTAGGHLPRSIQHLRYFAEEASRLDGQTFPLDRAYLNLTVREPLGVIAVIAPWNGPLAVATLNLGAALATGNTVVLKPPEKAPLSCWQLARMIHASGFPPGVINVVFGPGEPTGAYLVRHPGVDGICFVGATAVGRQILADTAPDLKKVTLELGGKSPTVVLADAPFEQAVDGALLAVFSSNGEVCTAGSRIVVEEPLYARFLERLVERARRIRLGDPQHADTEMGPLITRAHRDGVLATLEEARGEGATVACGGRPPPVRDRGFFLEPTILHEVPPESRVAREELFAPVACVVPARDAEAAVRLANDSAFGLAASIWSGDGARALALARELRVGAVGINSPIIRDIRAPFGGVKASGLGRLGGRWSLDAYTTPKTLSIPVERYPLPRLGLLQEDP